MMQGRVAAKALGLGRPEGQGGISAGSVLGSGLLGSKVATLSFRPIPEAPAVSHVTTSIPIPGIIPIRRVDTWSAAAHLALVSAKQLLLLEDIKPPRSENRVVRTLF